MVKAFVVPAKIILGGIVFFNLSVFAAEKNTNKADVPAKKAKTTEASSGEKADESKKKDAAAGKHNEDLKKILAVVNGENISQQDVSKILKRLGNQITEEQIPSVSSQILDGLITQKLLLQFIKNNKIEVKSADIDAELNKVREDIKANPDLAGQALEQVLETHGGSIEELKRDITISLSLEKYFGKDLDDKKLKAYFEQNKALYDDTEVRASHILVDTRQMKTDTELAQALEKIKKIKAEIDSGKDFAEVAKQSSDCPSKDKGGDLSFFKRKGQMVEPFAAASFALKVGQVSEPVKTPFGYHIIKVTDIKKGNDVNFDEIKRDVKVDMMSENVQSMIKKLRQDAKIEMKTGA